MKTRLKHLIAAAGLLLLPSASFQRAQAQGTAFTYQGRLNTNGVPASGSYDLAFTLYTTTTGGTPLAAPVTNAAVSVTNGLFTTVVNFGAIFTGESNWLQIAVSANGANAFSPLSPRQQLTPVPYALFANTASNLLGSVAVSQLPASVVTNDSSNLILSGLFTGNGANLTNVNAEALDGLSPASFWQLGGNNVAAGQFLGCINNLPLIVKVSGQEAERFEPTADTPNVVGGFGGNVVQPGLEGVTIGGGGSVMGNQPNIITNDGYYATIGGGYANTVAGYGGGTFAGSDNYLSGDFSFIGDGQSNTNLGEFSAIVGGYQNAIQPGYFYDALAFLGGGYQNNIQSVSQYSCLVGGVQNSIQEYDTASFLGGGYQNNIQYDSHENFLGGGVQNNIQAYDGWSVLVGGQLNTIQSGVAGSFLGGGTYDTIGTNDMGVFLGCGYQDAIQSNTINSFLGGGLQNLMGSNIYSSVLVGGSTNYVGAADAFLGGGQVNNIQPNSACSFLGGGEYNTIFAASGDSVICGGYDNVIDSNNNASFLGGGYGNFITAPYGVVGGGLFNGASGAYAAEGGGLKNDSKGGYSVVPGGANNYAGGDYSFAAGRQAQANYEGDFVWADSQAADFNSTASDQFLIRAQGGVGIGATNLVGNAALTIRTPMGAPANSMLAADNCLGIGQYATSGYKWVQSYGGSLTLNPLGNNVGVGTTNPAYLFQVGNSASPAYCNGTTWMNGSDRNAKQAFSAISPGEVLAKVSTMPITEWQYKADSDAIKHIGPMAQDFYAAFGLNGTDDKHISTVDEGGVALAAIQGLNQKLETEVQQKDAKIGELERRLNDLEQMVQSLAAPK